MVSLSSSVRSTFRQATFRSLRSKSPIITSTSQLMGRSPSHRSTRSSTTLTINGSKAFTCSLSRKGRTSTNSAWKSAAKLSMPSCSRLTRRVAFTRTSCEKCEIRRSSSTPAAIFSRSASFQSNRAAASRSRFRIRNCFTPTPGRSLISTRSALRNFPLGSIYSPSHKVEIKRDGANRAVIGYESKDEKPDTDFQLVYSSDTRDVGLRLITYKPEGDDGYFLIHAATTVSNEKKPAPKDVVFVVYTSGSMACAKLQQAQKALRFCVENLNADDRFEIVRFSTEAEPLFRELVTADSDH